MTEYLKLIRIKQWIKNFLIFIPIICGNVLTYNNIIVTILGFFSFSFASSFIYIINDIKDIEKDKLHPRKKKRPLASGKISKKRAIVISILMLFASLSLNYFINMQLINSSLYLLIIYILTNILYSFGLKNIAIIDIVILTLGFVVRVYYGSFLINIEVSNWLFLTVMSGALFLGLGKRKKELIQNKDVRKSLKDYTQEFLDKFQYTTLSMTLLFYSLWTMEKNVKYLPYTIPIVVVIFMQYCLDIEKQNEGDPVTIFYSDVFLLVTCILYAIVMLFVLVIL